MMLKKETDKILDPLLHPDQCQNLMGSSLAYAPSSHQVSGKLVHLFWGKAAKRQTDKEYMALKTQQRSQKR